MKTNYFIIILDIQLVLKPQLDYKLLLKLLVAFPRLDRLKLTKFLDLYGLHRIKFSQMLLLLGFFMFGIKIGENLVGD